VCYISTRKIISTENSIIVKEKLNTFLPFLTLQCPLKRLIFVTFVVERDEINPGRIKDSSPSSLERLICIIFPSLRLQMLDRF